uniref:Cyclin N-terminal domain-containing protein n=1 Tax=Triticum urartu TaxID=4572 RepID=A0A8R7UIY4_TRIUA
MTSGTPSQLSNTSLKFIASTDGPSCEPPTYMTHQTDINEKRHIFLIDWLIEVQYKLELLGETLFLAVNIIDRSMHRKVCLKFSLEWNLQVSHLFSEAYLEKNYKYYRKESKIMTVHWNMDFERIYMGLALCNYILLSLLMLLLML